MSLAQCVMLEVNKVEHLMQEARINSVVVTIIRIEVAIVTNS